MPCQRTSLTQLLSLAELVHLVFTVLREPLSMFPRKPFSLSGRQTRASPRAGSGGCSWSSRLFLQELDRVGSTGSLTGFGGPRRRLGMLEDAPISRAAVSRGAVGMGSGSTHRSRLQFPR